MGPSITVTRVQLLRMLAAAKPGHAFDLRFTISEQDKRVAECLARVTMPDKDTFTFSEEPRTVRVTHAPAARPRAESLAAGSGSHKYPDPGTTDWLDRGKPDHE